MSRRRLPRPRLTRWIRITPTPASKWIISGAYPPGEATFKKTSGTVEIDTAHFGARDAARTGTVDVVIDTATIDFAHDKLNAHVSSPEMLDVAKYPTAECKGKFVEFANGVPKIISGDLTLHGVTKPVTLTINSFKCFEHPMLKKQVCGPRGRCEVVCKSAYQSSAEAILVIRLIGQGAGRWPTAVSVLGDLHEVARLVESRRETPA